MKTTLVQSAAELERLEPSWQKLAAPSPMSSPAWLLAWWRHFGQTSESPGKRELFCVAVHDDRDELVGLAPWYLSRSTWKGRQIRALGDGKVCSDHVTVLARDGAQRAVSDEVAQFLFSQDARRLWDELDLNGVDHHDPAIGSLIKTIATNGLGLVDVLPTTSTWSVDLPPSWDEFLEGLSKNHRKRLRRWQRGYFDSGQAVRRTAANVAELDQYFQQLVSLHNQRRQSIGELGAFENATFAAFHADVIRRLWDAQSLQLSVLELNGQAVAAEYLLRDEHAWFAYQSGLDPAACEHSPGSLSLAAAIQHAIAAGARKFDFLRGDEEYKASWGAVACQSMRVRVSHQNLAGSFRRWSDRAMREVKRARAGTLAFLC